MLAAVKTCVIKSVDKSLDIRYYTALGATHVVDMACLQCLVAQVRDRNVWAILDCTGNLPTSYYAGEDLGDSFDD